MPGKL